MSTAGVGEGHSHDWPPRLIQRIRFLTRGFIIVGLSVAAIVVLVMLLIFQRGHQRDRENERLQQEIRDSWCQALDGFPQGNVFLDPLRERYHCGPGKPLDQLTPQEQEQVAGRNPAAVAPPAAPSPQPTAPPLGSGAVTDPPRPTENPPPQRPEPTPLVDLEPLTDPVCDATGVCI